MNVYRFLCSLLLSLVTVTYPQASKNMTFDASLNAALTDPNVWSRQFITIYELPDWETHYSRQDISKVISQISAFLTEIKSDVEKNTLSNAARQKQLDTLTKELGTILKKQVTTSIVQELKQLLEKKELPKKAAAQEKLQKSTPNAPLVVKPDLVPSPVEQEVKPTPPAKPTPASTGATSQTTMDSLKSEQTPTRFL